MIFGFVICMHELIFPGNFSVHIPKNGGEDKNAVVFAFFSIFVKFLHVLNTLENVTSSPYLRYFEIFFCSYSFETTDFTIFKVALSCLREVDMKL